MSPHTRAVLVCALASIALGCTTSRTASEKKKDAEGPITTSSPEARERYVEGRDLFEKLRLTDAREHFKKAVALDEGFALAWLGLANTAQSAKEFWDAVDRATKLADDVSEGERLMILGFAAGARSDPAAQGRHYRALVESFPEDERAINLLGVYHFGLQEYTEAIAAFDRAITLDPEYSPPYNLKGYAHRFLGNFDEAEAAFRRYIELIPDDPNPYDSYAELLMKTGRFEESIASYEKALEHDPYFVASYVGIGLDRLYMGEPARARESFTALLDRARTPGEKRAALFRVAQSWVFEGQPDKALEVVKEMSSVAEAEGDKAALAGDLNLAGNILLDAGKPDAALARFEEATEANAASNAPEEAKAAAGRNAIYNKARVALARGRVDEARSLASEYAERVAAHAVPFEQWQTHELEGLIALAEKDNSKAVAELRQANQQDPRVQYHLALALAGAGEAETARAACRKAAEDNSLSFNYAYVRDEAMKMLDAG